MGRRLFALGVIFCLVMGNGYAADRLITHQAITSTGYSTMPICSQATVYTQSFPIQSIDTAAIFYKGATNAGNVALDIQFEQSFEKPATEGSSDPDYHITDYLVTSASNTAWRVATIDGLVPMPYGRFKIIGKSGNSATTTLQIRLGLQ